MKLPRALVVVFALVLTGCEASAQNDFLNQSRDLLNRYGGGSGALGTAEIAAGLRDALKVGSGRVVGLLGTKDGFNRRPDVRIPLPGALGRAHNTLKRIGLGRYGDDLELRLNRAAEASVTKAKPLFLNAIKAMTIDDARRILNGPDDAATQYFRGKMSRPLAREMRPIVNRQIAQAGAVKAYDRMIAQYKTIPFVPDAKANLTDHVLDKAIGGLFLYLGREEAAIRKNPAKRTTAILRKVFGR